VKWIVAQLGARMHYAVPRILWDARLLSRLYTDICAVRGWPNLARLTPSLLQPAGLRRLLGRVPKEIPTSRVVAFTSFGWEYARRRRAANSAAQLTVTHLWAGQRFSELILEAKPEEGAATYGLNSGCLELLQDRRQRGCFTVVEQTIAPRRIEDQLLKTEQIQHPDWQATIPDDENVDAFVRRETAEWAEASLILCGSQFVKDGIASCGGPVERCVVLPYGIDGSFKMMRGNRTSGLLRVLTVGEVGLRKGAPKVFKLAEKLKGRAVFRWVGPISLLPAARERLAAVVELKGPVPRTEIQPDFYWADVFLLPSICEGSATVTYEALAAGLPVITTPNAGSIVEDGVSGFLIPPSDTGLMVEMLARLALDRALLNKMSIDAVERAQFGSYSAYAQRLHAALSL
jgi:glycosyltransferase involved in cell wall biosynthesis